MRTFKSILFSILILCFCSIGVIADSVNDQASSTETPKVVSSISYIDGNGQTQTATKVIQIQSNNPATLDFGENSGNWYWAGGEATADSKSTIDVSGVSLGTGKGTINLIVGPNGQANTEAMQITTGSNDGWSLSSGQILNIFLAGDTWSPETLRAGYLNLVNRTSGKSALTVSGGTLNIYSGIFLPLGSQAAGLAVSSGNVFISKFGQLEPIYNCTETESRAATFSATNYGLTITGGTVKNAGFIVPIQITLLETDTENLGGDFAGISNNPGTGQGLQVNGGTVTTATSLADAKVNLATGNGIWIQRFETTRTNIANAYGTATINLGEFDELDFSGTGQLTVNSGANLTIPDYFSLTFGTSRATTTPDGTLTVQGTLTIDENATVTMNANSVLVNSGTIDVQQSTPSTNS